MNHSNLARAILLAGIAAAGVNQKTLAQSLLKVDFNERPAILTAPGFVSFVIDPADGNAGSNIPTTRTFGDITLTLSGINASGNPANLDDRIRATPGNSGDFTFGEIYRDFVFYSADRLENSGLNLNVAGLTPNESYIFSIYSFDSGSTGTRVSDWFANGELVRENYTFNGSVLPTTNDQYRFDFIATATGTGEVLISARRDATSVSPTGAAEFGVFINALEISQVPEPGTISLFALGGALALLLRRRQNR
jgi:hypothetical protein